MMILPSKIKNMQIISMINFKISMIGKNLIRHPKKIKIIVVKIKIFNHLNNLLIILKKKIFRK
jgi:hypothetical protein